MKRLITSMLICASIILSFANCKKSYNCDCTVTIRDTNPGGLTYTSKSTQSIGEKMTDYQAAASCNETERQLEENLNQLEDDPTQIVTTACKVN